MRKRSQASTIHNTTLGAKEKEEEEEEGEGEEESGGERKEEREAREVRAREEGDISTASGIDINNSPAY